MDLQAYHVFSRILPSSPDEPIARRVTTARKWGVTWAYCCRLLREWQRTDMRPAAQWAAEVVLSRRSSILLPPGWRDEWPVYGTGRVHAADRGGVWGAAMLSMAESVVEWSSLRRRGTTPATPSSLDVEAYSLRYPETYALLWGEADAEATAARWLSEWKISYRWEQGEELDGLSVRYSDGWALPGHHTGSRVCIPPDHTQYGVVGGILILPGDSIPVLPPGAEGGHRPAPDQLLLDPKSIEWVGAEEARSRLGLEPEADLVAYRTPRSPRAMQ
jgi:hypothetical protein